MQTANKHPLKEAKKINWDFDTVPLYLNIIFQFCV